MIEHLRNDEQLTLPIATFNTPISDNLDTLQIKLEPKQEFNGYDHPWVGGAGTNKYPNCAISGTAIGVTITHNSTDESYKISGLSTAYRGFLATETFTLKAGTYTISRIASSSAVSESNLRMEIRSTDGQTIYGSSHANSGVFTLASDTEVKARIVVGQSNVDFGTGITYRFQIEVSTTASAWTPYENICPIYPDEGIGIVRTGKNLCLPNILSQTALNGITMTPTENGVRFVGTATQRFALFLTNQQFKPHVNFLAGSKVSFSLFYRGDISRLETPFSGYYKDLTTYGGNIGQLAASNNYKLTWTVPEAYANSEDSFIQAYAYIPAGVTVDVELGLQIETADTATSYEPYQGDNYSISLGREVYSGVLDVTTGVLTVTHGVEIYDGTEDWSTESTYNFYSDTGRGSGSDQTDYQCSHWKYNNIRASSTDISKMPSAYISTTGKFNVQRADISHTGAAMKQWCLNQYQNGTPLTVVFRLNTPQTYQLTSQQIKTLIGMNNIWSDSGGILHVGYRAMTEPSDSDYGTEVLTPTEDEPYLWNYERLAFTDGTHVDKEKHILAVYGSAGKGIQKVEKEYYLSTSDTSVTGGSWGTTIPSIDVSKYLWTRDKITYTTGDLGYTTPECITKYTSDIVAPDISNAITTANDYSAGLVTTERDARLEAIETITTNYDNLASTVSSNSTSIATNAQNIELRATKTEVTQLSNALAEVQQFRTTTTNYLTFDATRGLVMSATINGVKSPVESVINNSAWQLVTSGKVVQQVDANEGAQFSAIVLKALSANDIPTLTLGHLVISVQTNGTVIGKKA